MKPPAGSDGTVLARWREAGEWWIGEPMREVCRYLDTQGVRQEVERLLPGFTPLEGQRPLEEDHSEEWAIRERKIRDEKVAAACGALPASYYERTAKERNKKAPSPYRGPKATASPPRDTSLETWQGSPTQAPYDENVDVVQRNRVMERLAYSGFRQGSETAATKEHTATTPPRAVSYVPLHVVSGYAFGRSTMLAEEIPVFAAAGGCPAAAIADSFSLIGCWEFVKASQRVGIKPLVGTAIELPEGGEIVLIARSKRGYQALSQLVTECHLGEPRLHPLATWARLERYAVDLVCLTGGDQGPLDRALIRRDFATADALLEKLVGLYGRANVFVEIERSDLPWERGLYPLLREIAERHGLTCVAGGPATHARREHFPAQDILVCADSLCTVDEVLGRKPRRHPSQPQLKPRPERALNGERFLRTVAEMSERFADAPELLENTFRVAERCDDNVLPARTRLPELFPDSAHALREIVYAGAYGVYPQLKPAIRKRIDFELERIIRLSFANHFLVAWDMCRWAREEGIQLSGRGSVIDSAVSYCLGFSRIDAIRHRLHFDRFLPEDGSKRPDIDIDFEARRREDVRTYLTHKYGIDRVATVAAIGAYNTRGIIREVGKALGLPNETITFLAKKIHGSVPPDQIESALERKPELRASGIPKERFRWVFRLAKQLMDVPRNLRAHSSGVVISDRPICETVPVVRGATPIAEAEEGVGLPEDANPEALGEVRDLRLIQWDKRSAKHCFDKFDILCLRGQDVLAGAEERIRITTDPAFSATRVPVDDAETFRAMRSGELIGIPQSASPAMRQAHIRLRTENLDDASLVQAGIRPGVGGAVKINELIARRRGIKPYSFDHPKLEAILGHTYGIIVFQEQVDLLLQEFAGCTSGEAEDLRDAIHKRRREDYGRMIREELLGRIRGQGYSDAIADQVFEYIAGFKGYGFAQGHALAFAEISIRSIWLQQNHPAEYFSALLDAQPAGYYGPCTLVNEARSRGVQILSPDVNRSAYKFTVEDALATDPTLRLPGGAIRVGLRQISGISRELSARIEEISEEEEAAGTNVASSSSSDTHTSQDRSRLRTGAVDSFLGGVAVAVAEDQEEVERPLRRRFRSVFDFCAKVRPERDELERLILCGALDSLHANRRAMLWAIPAALDYAASVNGLTGCLPLEMPEPPLPIGVADFSPEERALHERTLLDLDLDRHLMAFERERVASRGGITASEAKRLNAGDKRIVVGNPIRLRFPPTPSGKRVVFFDLEDETGLLNVTCFDAVYQRDGHAIVCSPYVTIIGEAQDRDGHIAFLAHRVFPYRPELMRGREFLHLPVTVADFLVG